MRWYIYLQFLRCIALSLSLSLYVNMHIADYFRTRACTLGLNQVRLSHAFPMFAQFHLVVRSVDQLHRQRTMVLQAKSKTGRLKHRPAVLWVNRMNPTKVGFIICK
jgi:hypothetical protein